MIKVITYFLKISILSVIMIAQASAGGGRRNGTAGAQELLIPVGARGLAFNGAYLSGLKGVEAIFYNPAGLAASNLSSEAMFSYMNYIADIGVSYAAIGTQFEGFGSLGLSIKSIDFGDILQTTTQNPYGTGSTFSPTFVTVGITYANSLTDRIQVGVTGNLISENIISTSATGIAFNVGVQYSNVVDISGLNFGVVLKNFGGQITFDGPDLLRQADAINTLRGQQFYKIDGAKFELPSQVQLGISYKKNINEDYRFLVIGSFDNNNFSNDDYKIAGEFAFQETFFLRGGYSYMASPSGQEEEQLFGSTFGAGFNVNTGIDITVDYAYRSAKYFEANHVFTIKLGIE